MSSLLENLADRVAALEVVPGLEYFGGFPTPKYDKYDARITTGATLRTNIGDGPTISAPGGVATYDTTLIRGVSYSTGAVVSSLASYTSSQQLRARHGHIIVFQAELSSVGSNVGLEFGVSNEAVLQYSSTRHTAHFRYYPDLGDAQLRCLVNAGAAATYASVETVSVAPAGSTRYNFLLLIQPGGTLYEFWYCAGVPSSTNKYTKIGEADSGDAIPGVDTDMEIRAGVLTNSAISRSLSLQSVRHIYF